MAQPFDFNTPITKNTVLVARYKADTSPYAGQWFRVTTSDGKRYVPESLEQAEAAASTPITVSNTVTLLDVETGSTATILNNNIVKFEFGGGWRTLNSDFFALQYNDSTHVCNIRTITGYPEGLAPAQDSNAFFAIPNGSMSWRYNDLNIDVTGFKFDANIYNYMMYYYSGTSRMYGGIFGTFYSSGFEGLIGGGGIYGVVEPLVPTSSVSIDAYRKAAMFAGPHVGSLNYTKGIGFAGEYAQQWASAFPSNNKYPYRNTYVA